MTPMRRTGAHRSGTGYTLIELVAAIGVSAIIAGIVAPPLMEAIRTRHGIVTRGALLQEGRTALERLTRELREIPYDAAAPNCPAIATADADEIECSGASFRFHGGALVRREPGGAAWQPLARHVTAGVFTYYDEDGGVLSATPLSPQDRAKVRRIGVEMMFGCAGETLRLRSGVFLRAFAFRRT